MSLYTGAESVLRNISDVYCGINGEVRKISSMYCGKDGVLEVIYEPYNSGAEEDNWEFTTNSSYSLVTKYIGRGSKINIPAYLNGTRVMLKEANIVSGVFSNISSNFSVMSNENVRYENNSMAYAFCNCGKLVDFSGNISSRVTNMSMAFYMCENLRSWNSSIPSTTKDISNTFAYCGAVSEFPEIPLNVTNLQYAFYKSNFTGDIHIKSARVSNAYNFIHADGRRFNIYLRRNSTTESTIFDDTSSGSSIVGNTISWTNSTDGFYNAGYNVYVYYT